MAGSRSSSTAVEDGSHELQVLDEVVNEPNDLDGRATTLLSIQQLSSSLSFRAAEFAIPLYLITVFTDTLLPASVYGFVTTAAAIVFSGSVGGLTDRYRSHRRPTARLFVLAQKILVVASYALFHIFFADPNLTQAVQDKNTNAGTQSNSRKAWVNFAAIVLLGCGLILSNVGVSVTIERDWVTSIAKGSSRRLTRLNAIMRRVDLISKLVAPLFVSLLTTTVGYRNSCISLMAISGGTTIFELLFLNIIFRRFTVLGEEQAAHRQQMAVQETRSDQSQLSLQSLWTSLKAWILAQWNDWRTFARMPIFISSICISLLYMSVLSFDSTFIAYLKSETDYSDAFIAGMRGVCVVTGLLGTFVSPIFTEKIGLVRTGSYSLWLELLPLSLSIVSFYQGAHVPHRPAWNTALLFTGLALSRIGLWSFDLAQLAQVQTALATHPRRNALMGLQFALQNLLDLLHYAMGIAFSKPSMFRIPADISYGAIGLATVLYVTVYARRERGHLLHLDKLSLEWLLGHKTQ